MLNTVGTRVSSGCYDNRHWKFKDPAAGSIPCKEGYFTLKLHTTATVLFCFDETCSTDTHASHLFFFSPGQFN